MTETGPGQRADVASEGHDLGRRVVWAVPGERAEPPKWPAFSTSLSDELRRIGIAPPGPANELADRRGPITVIGATDGGAAVAVAAAAPGVDSMVLVHARLDDDAIDLIAELDHVAVLTVVDPQHRDRLEQAVEGHLSSTHDGSRIIIDSFEPPGAAQSIARWIQGVDDAATVVEEVAIVTPDGWVLGADLHRPSAGAWPHPAVVLMHSGRSDRTVFDRLARLLARRGVVALALDWRGRGTSTNRGRFVDFTAEQQAEVRWDVAASYDHLAARSDVDAARLGVLGVAHGAGFAADGALGDPRTRAIALMTAIHHPDDRQRAALGSGEVSGLYVTSSSRSASTSSLRALYELTAGPRTRMLQYPEGVLGYQMFEMHPELEPTIAGWFGEVLGAEPIGEATRERSAATWRRTSPVASLSAHRLRAVSAIPPIEPSAADEAVAFAAADGWELSGIYRRRDPGFADSGAAAVLVHAPHHERDAYIYGRALPDVLAARGIASIRFDIRGRGASRSPRPWSSLTVLERRAVALDVAAAADVVRERAGVGPGALGVVAEQDVVSAALAACDTDQDIGGVVLISPRFGRAGVGRPARRWPPTCALVSPEDRRGLRDAVAAYLAAPPEHSELHVLPGLGLGTTMFMARAFEQPDEVPLEVIVARWLERVLSA